MAVDDRLVINHLLNHSCLSLVVYHCVRFWRRLFSSLFTTHPSFFIQATLYSLLYHKCYYNYSFITTRITGVFFSKI